MAPNEDPSHIQGANVNANVAPNPSTTPQPETFPRLSRWLDMFDEIRNTEPQDPKK